MKLTKRISVLLLCLLMVVALFPAALSAADVSTTANSKCFHEAFSFDTAENGKLSDYVSAQLSGGGITVSGISAWSVVEDDDNSNNKYIASKSYASGGFTFVGEELLTDAIFDLSFCVRMRFNKDDTTINAGNITFPLVRLSASSAASSDTTTTNALTVYTNKAEDRGENGENIGVFAYNTGGGTGGHTASTYAVKAETWYSIRLVYDTLNNKGTVDITDGTTPFTMSVNCLDLTSVYQVLLCRGYNKNYLSVDLDDVSFSSYEEVAGAALDLDAYNDFNDLSAGALSKVPAMAGLTGTIGNASKITVVKETAGGNQYLTLPGGTTTAFTYEDTASVLHTGDFVVSYRLKTDSATGGTCSLLSLKEGVNSVEMRIFHASGNTVYFGPSTSYSLFSLSTTEWNELTCVVKPATETYEIYLDGVLKAYTVIEEVNGESAYVLYRNYSESTGSWTRNANPSWGSEKRIPYGYNIGENKIASIYLFHNNTRAFSIDDFRVYGVKSETLKEITFPTETLYQMDFSKIYIGGPSLCCWNSASPAGLSALKTLGEVKEKTYGDTTSQFFAAASEGAAVELALEDGSYSYLDSGTLWIEGTFVLDSENADDAQLVFAALNHAKFNSAPLVTVDGTGALSLLGSATGKTLTPDTATVLKVSVDSKTGTVALYVGDSEKAVATATLSADKYTSDITYSHADAEKSYFSGIPFADTLTLFSTDSMSFGVADIRVYCEDNSPLEIFGIQQGTFEDTNAIRVLAGISNLNYSKVGYTFELWDSATNSWEQKADVNSNTVFTSVTAAGETVTAESRGYRYIAAAVLYGIDETSGDILCIRPYTVKDGVRNYGEAAIYRVAVSDGSLSIEKTAISNSVGYTLISEQSFEDWDENFSQYGTSSYESLVSTESEYKWGGQLNTSSPVIGAKTDDARTGNKAISITNLKEATPSSGSLTFGGRIKLSHILPDQLTDYTGKTIRISAYVKMDAFKKISDGTVSDADGTISASFGVMSDATLNMSYAKSFPFTEGEWTYVTYEFDVDDILNDNTNFPNVSGTSYHYPVRPFLVLGSSAGYATEVYIDDFKVEYKGSFGVTLPSIFADNMVLQRNKTVPIWGWGGTPGHVIEATIGDYSATGTVDANGEFYMELPKMEGASNQTLTITNTGKENANVSFTNVGIGEVWYCSGQSNMELKMSSVFDTEEIVANADLYDVRTFKVGVKATYELQKDVSSGSWSQITSSNVKNVTAIGYIAAYQLQKELGVPVAIIECYQGGSAAQAWLNYERLFATDREFIYNDASILPSARNNWGCEGRTLWQDYDYYWSVGEIYDTTASEGTLIDGAYGSAGERFAPTGFYNAMQGPLANYAIAGVMWYQGESQPNARIPDQYNYLLFDLIEQWREDFRDEDLPVMLVQLAPYSAETGRSFVGIRQVQLDTAKRLENIGVISTAYEGTFDDKDTGGTIHPGTKVPVGNRMAATILAMVYGKTYYEGTDEYTGPVYEYMEVEGNQSILHFSHIGDGLKIKDGDTALTGFKISGDGTTFVDATATIVGDTVVVTADSVTSPVAVQYAYVNTYAVTGAPDTLGSNLENSISQPALPFLATLGDAEIHGAKAVDGKLQVEIWELGHNETAYTVVINGNTEKAYTASFETAGNFIITTEIAVSAGDSVTVTLKSADGATEIETKTVTVE